MELTRLEFNYNGHRYNVVKVEDSDRFSVVRDGKTVRHISNQDLTAAVSNKDHMQVIEQLFNDAGR